MPSKSGSMMSSTATSGVSLAAWVTAAAPVCATVTSQPSRRSAMPSSSAIVGSSSTTSTRNGDPSGRVSVGQDGGSDVGHDHDDP